jgi:hypothetical protein
MVESALSRLGIYQYTAEMEYLIKMNAQKVWYMYGGNNVDRAWENVKFVSKHPFECM